MEQPIRSFNLDKLVRAYNPQQSNTFLLEDGGLVSFPTSDSFALPLFWGLEVKFKTRSTFTGSIDLFRIYDENSQELRITLNGDLTVDAFCGNSTTLYNGVSGLTPNADHAVYLGNYRAENKIYLDGIQFSGVLSTPVFDLWPIGREPAAEIRSYGGEIEIKTVKLYSRPSFDSTILNSFQNDNYDISFLSWSLGYWDFRKNLSNSIISDSSSSGNHGFINKQTDTQFQVNTSPAWKSNATTEAYVNNSTMLPYMENRDVGFSAEGWVYIDEDDLTNIPYVIRFINPNNTLNPIQLGFGTSERTFCVIIDSSNTPYSRSGPKVPLKQWAHIGWSFTPGTSEFLYSVNGEVTSDNIGTALKKFDMTSLSGVLFGDFRGNNISIRNWCIYEVGLTKEELEASYKYTTDYPVADEYVIAEWKFQEESTGWAYDCSDHGNYLYPQTNVAPNDITFEYVEESGFYPQMWDGYGIAATATDIDGQMFSFADPSLEIYDYTVTECLYFLAYHDYRRNGNGIPTDSFTFAQAYGIYITNEENNAIDNPYLRSTLYQDVSGDISPGAYEIPDTRTERIRTMDGQWHHVVVIYSSDQYFENTPYNFLIYHNGKLAGAATADEFTGYDPQYSGRTWIGHYLNGAVAMARLYNPTASGIQQWLNGNYLARTADFSVIDGTEFIDPGLVFEAGFDRDTQTVSNQTGGFPQNQAFDLDVTANKLVGKIPLNYIGFTVAGTIPEIPTPKYAITDINIDSEYSLSCQFKINSKSLASQNLSVIESDTINFTISSGIYYATVTPSVTVSGVINSYETHSIVFRYRDNEASFLYNYEEVYSGISTDWNSPQETVKWGFYCNPATMYDTVVVKRIAAFDIWLSEDEIIDRGNSEDLLAYYPLKGDLYNSKQSLNQEV